MKIIPPHSGGRGAHSAHNARVPQLGLNERGGTAARNANFPGNLPSTRVGQAVLNSFRAAGLPINELQAARVLQAAQNLVLLHPAIPLARLSRVLLELELRGQSLAPDRVDALLRGDDFALPVGERKNYPDDGNPGGPGNRGDHETPRDPHSEPEPENDIHDALSRPALDQKGREISPSWHWLSLVPQSWNRGGSLRWAQEKRGMQVNIDLLVDEGMWQFHWSEPDRRRIIVAAPEQNLRGFSNREWLPLLENLIGPLGFRTFYELAPDDWFDGFNFLASESILRRVDMVV